MATLNTALAAYVGAIPVQRIYLGANLVWDNQQMYTAGDLAVAAAAVIAGETQEPEESDLSATAIGGGCAEPQTQGFAGLAAANGTMIAAALPQAVTPQSTAMPGAARLFGICMGDTQGQVPVSGLAGLRLAVACEPRNTETVYGTGAAELGDIHGAAAPLIANKVHGTGTGMLDGICGSVGGTEQAPAQVTAQAPIRLTGILAPILKKMCVVTFVHDGETLYETQVLAGNSCPDPVAAGLVEVPVKAPTSQDTYTYSGWTTVEGTEADSSVLENIADDTVLYAAFVTTPTQTAEVLPLRTIEFASSADFKTDSGTDAYYANLADTGELASGNTYIVEWDGVEYTCVARDVPYGSMSHPNTIGCTSHARKHWILGGFAKYSTTEAATGEPFNIWYSSSQMYMCTTSTNESHTVRIYQAT